MRLEDLYTGDIFDLEGGAFIVMSEAKEGRKQCQPIFGSLLMGPMELDCNLDVVPHQNKGNIAAERERCKSLAIRLSRYHRKQWNLTGNRYHEAAIEVCEELAEQIGSGEQL